MKTQGVKLEIKYQFIIADDSGRFISPAVVSLSEAKKMIKKILKASDADEDVDELLYDSGYNINDDDYFVPGYPYFLWEDLDDFIVLVKKSGGEIMRDNDKGEGEYWEEFLIEEVK